MDSDVPSAKIDTTVPVSARIWNYWLGGKDYYPVDKEAGDQFAQIYPGIFDGARASRYFIARVVRYLAEEAGIRQFLDIGTGLPTQDNTHEIAQRAAPDSRIVYADNDPLVLAHARALLTSNPAGSTDYIDADLNDPGALLRTARGKLDFSRPVAIMLMGVLAHIGNPAEDDDRAAQSIVGTLKAALPPGGYLAVYDSSDADPALNDALLKYNETGAAPYRVRRPDQIARYFDGLELAEPGVVPIQQWRPDHTPFGPPGNLSNNLGGVGRKLLRGISPGAASTGNPRRAVICLICLRGSCAGVNEVALAGLLPVLAAGWPAQAPMTGGSPRPANGRPNQARSGPVTASPGRAW